MIRTFAVAFAAFWLILLAAPMFLSPPSLYSGVHLVLTGARIQRNTIRIDRDSPAYRAGLRSGDVLGCLSPRDYALLLNPGFGYVQGYRPGTVISACAHRTGAVHRVHFIAQSRGNVYNAYGNEVLLALRLLVFIVFVVTGTALVLARPSLMTWIFFAFCIGNAPAQAGLQVWSILPSWQYTILAELPRIAPSMAGAFLLLFALLVPSERVPPGWRRAAFYIACGLAAADLLMVVVSIFYTDLTIRPLRNDLDQVLTALTLAVIGARLLTMERTERTRFGWAAFGIACGVVVNDIRNIFIAQEWLNIAAAELTVVTPLCLMYAILRRHVIDVTFVINRVVVFAVIGAMLAGVFLGVDWLFATFFVNSRLQIAIDFVLAACIALALRTSYERIVALANSVLFPKREQRLKRVRDLRLQAEEDSGDSIQVLLIDRASEALGLASAALFQRTPDGGFVREHAIGWGLGTAWHLLDDDEIVKRLERRRTPFRLNDVAWQDVAIPGGSARPVLVVPLTFRRKIAALALYGSHNDGADIDPDEARGLAQLCAAAAPSFDHVAPVQLAAAAVSLAP